MTPIAAAVVKALHHYRHRRGLRVFRPRTYSLRDAGDVLGIEQPYTEDDDGIRDVNVLATLGCLFGLALLIGLAWWLGTTALIAIGGAA